MKLIQLLVIVLCLLLPQKASSIAVEKIPDGIILAMKAGNAAELAKYFNDHIELIILKEEDVYSKSQAEQIMKKFFAEHKAVGFKIIFEGGKSNSRYAIGNLTTQKGSFRVYFLFKGSGNDALIHQLRIETEDEHQG